jgi:uridine phosphorylase
VRIGTSGTIRPEIPVGSFVASRAAFAIDGVPHTYMHEAEASELALSEALQKNFPHLLHHPSLYAVFGSEELLARVAFDMIQGITATANGFYGPQGRTVRLISKMSPVLDEYATFEHNGMHITNFEMECAGIYALASLLGHRALTVCAILANRSTKEFHNNPSASIETLINQVIQRF